MGRTPAVGPHKRTRYERHGAPLVPRHVVDPGLLRTSRRPTGLVLGEPLVLSSPTGPEVSSQSSECAGVQVKCRADSDLDLLRAGVGRGGGREEPHLS